MWWIKIIELYERELSELLVFCHSLGLKCLDVSLYRESTFRIRQNVWVTFQNKLQVLKDKELGQQTRQMKGIEEMKGACKLDLIRSGGVLKPYSVADTQHCWNGKIN